MASKFPYADQLTRIAHSEQEAITLDDLAEFDPELAAAVQNNTRRHNMPAADAVWVLLPDYRENDPPARDALDLYTNHRQLLEATTRQPDQDQESRKEFPPELIRRYEVFFKSSSATKTTPIRLVYASSIGKQGTTSTVDHPKMPTLEDDTMKFKKLIEKKDRRIQFLELKVEKLMQGKISDESGDSLIIYLQEDEIKLQEEGKQESLDGNPSPVQPPNEERKKSAIRPPKEERTRSPIRAPVDQIIQFKYSSLRWGGGGGHGGRQYGGDRGMVGRRRVGRGYGGDGGGRFGRYGRGNGGGRGYGGDGGGRGYERGAEAGRGYGRRRGGGYGRFRGRGYGSGRGYGD